MYKLLLSITLIIFCGSSYAANSDKYAEALGWQNKWEKVIERQVYKYAERIKHAELGKLSEVKQKQVTNKLRKMIGKSFSWKNVGNQFTQNIVDSCGTDLLDKFVDFYSGVKFSAAERKKMSSAYEECGRNAIADSMILIQSALFNRNDTAYERLSRTVGGIIIIKKDARKSFANKYLDAKGHKAFAQSDSGNWNWRSNRTSKQHAINNALASCRARNLGFENRQPCKIVHLNDDWTDMYRQTDTPVAKSESDIMTNKALGSYRKKYMAVNTNKAFAQSVNGSWSWRSSKTSRNEAIKKALSSCQQNNKKYEALYPCKIINVNNEWRAD